MSRCVSEVDLNFMTDGSTRCFVGGSCCKTLKLSRISLFIADCLLLLRLIFVSAMFSAMLDDDFIMLIGALFLCKSYNCRTRTYTRRMFRSRDTHSEFLLMNEMRLYDEESHMKYFLMDRVKFDFLLSKVGPHLLHAGTHEFPISAKLLLLLPSTNYSLSPWT